MTNLLNLLGHDTVLAAAECVGLVGLVGVAGWVDGFGEVALESLWWGC